MNDKMNWKNVLTIGGAYTAYCIGAGFASGQETLQYYASWGGIYPFVLPALTFVLMFVICYGTFKTGYINRFPSPNAAYGYYCGKVLGKILDIFCTVSIALSTLIMFAVVQGLYLLQRDEEKKNREKQIKEQMAAGAVYANHGYGYPNQGYAAPGYGAGGYGNYPVNSGYGSYDDGYGAAPPNGGYNGYPDAYGGYPQGGYGDDGYYDDDGYPQDGYGYDDSYGDGRPDSYENGYDDGYSYGNGGGDYEQEENRTYKDRQYGQKKGIDRRTGRR